MAIDSNQNCSTVHYYNRDRPKQSFMLNIYLSRKIKHMLPNKIWRTSLIVSILRTPPTITTSTPIIAENSMSSLSSSVTFGMSRGTPGILSWPLLYSVPPAITLHTTASSAVTKYLKKLQSFYSLLIFWDMISTYFIYE